MWEPIGLFRATTKICPKARTSLGVLCLTQKQGNTDTDASRLFRIGPVRWQTGFTASERKEEEMPKLNQIIAVLNGKKTQSSKDITEVYKKLQKNALFEGISRTYQPMDEDGETQPPERKSVQYSAKQAMDDARRALTDLFNVTATQDFANCDARADVVVDGQTLVENSPVTHLLFLEKQLTDLHTFVTTIPTLDAGETWNWDETADCYSSEPFITNRTKKTPRSHILYEATKEHPAQVEMYTEDVKVGEWKTIKFSGSLPATEKNQIVDRIRRLQEAVKFARETANGKDIEQLKTADRIFGYLFGAQS